MEDSPYPAAPDPRRHTSPPTWFLLILSGVILGMAYPPNPVGIFGSIGLVPLLYALERARSLRQVIGWTYVSFVIFSALTSWWIGSWQAKTDPFLMISAVLLVLFHPLFFMVPLILYWLVRRATSPIYALVFLPFLWAGGEYIHALGDASYPWLTLGNTQTYNLYYIQFIEFTGVWGLSFLLMVQNCAIAAMFISTDMDVRLRRRIFTVGAWIVVATLVPAYLYGFWAVSQGRSSIPGRAMRITAVQPNEDPWEKWNQLDTTDHIRVNFSLSDQALRQGRRPDMFLWAENAIPYPMTQPGDTWEMRRMMAAVDSLGVPVMSGFPDFTRYAPGQAPPSAKSMVVANGLGGSDTIRYDHFNSVGLFVPRVGLTGAYHKMQLVPFGERVPFADDVPFLISMLQWDVGISSWGKGKHVTLFHVPYHGDTAVGGSVICIESIYPNVVRRFVAKGAQFLTIITNDGWYLGTPGPLQHERIAIMRAIENRRAIARAGNTGISAFITPYGFIHDETDQGIATTTTGTISLRDDLTLYVRWGDWWPQLCIAVAVVMGGWAIVQWRRNRPTAIRGRIQHTGSDRPA